MRWSRLWLEDLAAGVFVVLRGQEAGALLRTVPYWMAPTSWSAKGVKGRFMKWLRLRLALPVVVLLLGTLGQVRGAHAHTATCRTDPTISLSNGVTMRLYEDIGDDPADVTGIRYILIVPDSVSIKSVSFSGPVPDSAQSVALIQAEMPGTYDEYAYVDTEASNVPVVAYMSASGTGSVHINGHSRQLLHAHLGVG